MLPRAVKVALTPLEKWIVEKEFNMAAVRKLLEEKLKDVNPEMIESPEPYIAVPALQYISYCMDNNELRNMYANLLANSMNKVVKNGVHPGFIEIIKQLCPDEAKVLRYMYYGHDVVPTIMLRYAANEIESRIVSCIVIAKNFSNIGELVNCEYPLDINKYFVNMNRLGLVDFAGYGSTLTDKTLYEPLKCHKHIMSLVNNAVNNTEYQKPWIQESYVMLTDYGKSFCSVCLSVEN